MFNFLSSVFLGLSSLAFSAFGADEEKGILIVDMTNLTFEAAHHPVEQLVKVLRGANHFVDHLRIRGNTLYLENVLLERRIPKTISSLVILSPTSVVHNNGFLKELVFGEADLSIGMNAQTVEGAHGGTKEFLDLFRRVNNRGPFYRLAPDATVTMQMCSSVCTTIDGDQARGVRRSLANFFDAKDLEVRFAITDLTAPSFDQKDPVRPRAGRFFSALVTTLAAVSLVTSTAAAIAFEEPLALITGVVGLVAFGGLGLGQKFAEKNQQKQQKEQDHLRALTEGVVIQRVAGSGEEVEREIYSKETLGELLNASPAGRAVLSEAANHPHLCLKASWIAAALSLL